MSAIPFNGLIQLYSDMVEHIAGTGIIKWVDLDLGQVEDKENEIIIEYPAVLIQLGEVQWFKETGDGAQKGVAVVTLKMAFQLLNEEDWQAQFQVRDEIQGYFETMGIVHEAISGIYSEYYSTLKLFNQYNKPTTVKDKMWIHILQYRTNIQTNGGIDAPDSVEINMDICRDDNDFLERKEYNLMSK